MIYVMPGQRLSCTTGSAATPRKRSCHLTVETVSPRRKILALEWLSRASAFLDKEIHADHRTALALGAKVR